MHLVIPGETLLRKAIGRSRTKSGVPNRMKEKKEVTVVLGVPQAGRDRFDLLRKGFRNAQCENGSLPALECLTISNGLGRDQRSEGKRGVGASYGIGNGNVRHGFGYELDEMSVAAISFVKLSCGVKETRTVPQVTAMPWRS